MRTMIKRVVMWLYNHRVISMRQTENLFRKFRLSKY